MDEDERNIINIAKGLLMHKFDFDENTAYHTIRFLAMKRRVSRVSVAEELIKSYAD